MSVGQAIFDFFYYFFTVYTLSIFGMYLLLSLASLFGVRRYFKMKSFTRYSAVLSSPFSPSVSLLVPLFNEQEGAVTTVKSLLSNEYSNHSLFVINDGSKDDTLNRLIEAFQLVPSVYQYTEKIKTKTVRGVYQSTNKAFARLIVLDKDNGGKSDALNAGLNVSNDRFVVSVDGDCVLASDALQKLVKPFLNSSTKVLATGSVIRIANQCKVNDGQLIDINLPQKQLIRFQVLEYLRSFLLARMGWSKYKGMMLISGALGMFEREDLIEVNGYDTNSIGEDMDVVIKLQRLMYDRDEKFKIVYLPDPLCWTEAPEKIAEFCSQRKRWARGTISSLWNHKKVLFRPKYGIMGNLAYPCWVIYERFGPLIELAGIVYFVGASLLGFVNWMYTISFLIATYLFAILYSVFGLLAEDLTYHQYRKKGDLRKLLWTIISEPFSYHLYLLYPAVLATIAELFQFKKSWGAIEHKGLESKKVLP